MKYSVRQIKEMYPYLYETHLHTSQGSACAQNTGAEMAAACKKAGYTGIFVTDHNWGGNTAVDRQLPWAEWVKGFAAGYREARRTGEKVGLDVFFGWESCFQATEFLIYGVSEEWLLEHPQIREATVEEQYAMVHEAGGMVIHAHPFRREDYIPQVRLFPEYVDGVEGVNATHVSSKSTGHKSEAYDRSAREYAAGHHLPITAGSDIHTVRLFGGGTAFKRKLLSGADYGKAVLAGEEYVLTDGERWYDRQGRLLAEE